MAGDGRNGVEREEREGKKIGRSARTTEETSAGETTGRARACNVREKERERKRGDTRHGTATSCTRNTRACTRTKYGRLSSNSPFSAPSAFVILACVRECGTRRRACSLSLSLSSSFLLSSSLSLAFSLSLSFYLRFSRILSLISALSLSFFLSSFFSLSFAFSLSLSLMRARARSPQVASGIVMHLLSSLLSPRSRPR